MNDVLVLISAVQKWKFEDEKTHEMRQGVTVHMTHVLQPSTSDDTFGSKPVKYSIPYDQFSVFAGSKYPALANVDFYMDFAKGKAVPVEFKNIRAVDFKELAEMV